MSRKVKLICQYCEEGTLVPIYDSDEVLYGYHCNTVELQPDGEKDQCYSLIAPSEYRRRVKELAPQTNKTTQLPSLSSLPNGGYRGKPLLTIPDRPLGKAFIPELNRKETKVTENIATYTKRLNVLLKQAGKPLIPIDGISVDYDTDTTSRRITRGAAAEPIDSDDDEHGIHYDSQASESSSEESEDELSEETETETDNRLYADTEMDRIDDLADEVNFEQAKDDEDYQNTVKALQDNTLQVKRQSLFEGLPYAGYLNDQFENYREPFKAPEIDPFLKRYIPSDNTKQYAKLGVNYASLERITTLKPFKVPGKLDLQAIQEKKMEELQKQQQADMQKILAERPIPADYKPLVVWQPSEDDLERFPDLVPIEVPPVVGHWLRDHQREGVKFLSECVLDQREYLGSGAILADDMGLGKTLQSVALIYTLLNQGFERGKTICKKVIVVCPTSLVSNWAYEFEKWIGEGVVKVLPLLEGGKKAASRLNDEYVNGSTQVLVLSYDALRRYMKLILKRDCDLLICDEAHRLKNHETATYKTLNQLQCRRRVLLSGTPMQNNLNEFYAMVSFANPSVFGDQKRFTRMFITPITRGREPDATQREKELGDRSALRLGRLVNHFILRRTNHLLSKHLPPKVIQVVCCQLSPLQKAIYAIISQQKAIMQLLEMEQAENTVMSIEDIFGKSSGLDFDDDGDDSNSNTTKKRGRGGGGARGGNGNSPATKGVLPLINMLKQLSNHPKITYDSIAEKDEHLRDELEMNIMNIFPRNFLQNGLHPNYSGKIMALDRLMCAVRSKSDDKFVLVSNYTQTLDVIEALCRYRKWSFLRVDGSTNIKKRQQSVDQLCAKSSQIVAFLLSSKAGGCGLNLVGANRLVLVDPDWNPAVDKQAAGRIWRDGQKKRCFVYRLLSTGTIDEKIFQRQLSKDGLTEVMGGSNAEANVSTKVLKELFKYNEYSPSDTHDTLNCSCLHPDNPGEITDFSYLGNEELFSDEHNRRSLHVIPNTNTPVLRVPHLQRGWALESDMGDWSHHSSILTMPDPLFRLATEDRHRGVADPSALVVKKRDGIGITAPSRASVRRPRADEAAFLAEAGLIPGGGGHNDKTVPIYNITTSVCNFQPEDAVANPVTMVLSLEVTGKPLPNDEGWKHFSSLTFRFQTPEGDSTVNDASTNPESKTKEMNDKDHSHDNEDGNDNNGDDDDDDDDANDKDSDDGLIPNYDTDEPKSILPRYLRSPEEIEAEEEFYREQMNMPDKKAKKTKASTKGKPRGKQAAKERGGAKKKKRGKNIVDTDDDDFDGDPNDRGSDLDDFIVNSDDDDDGDHHGGGGDDDYLPKPKKFKPNQLLLDAKHNTFKSPDSSPSGSSESSQSQSQSQSQTQSQYASQCNPSDDRDGGDDNLFDDDGDQIIEVTSYHPSTGLNSPPVKRKYPQASSLRQLAHP